MLDEHMAAGFGDAPAFLQRRGQSQRCFHHLCGHGDKITACIAIDNAVFAEIETFHRCAMAALELLGEQHVGIETELRLQHGFRLIRVCGHGPFFGHHDRKYKAVSEVFDNYRNS